VVASCTRQQNLTGKVKMFNEIWEEFEKNVNAITERSIQELHKKIDDLVAGQSKQENSEAQNA
jgi:DNA anti-recombination protein RmuC